MKEQNQWDELRRERRNALKKEITEINNQLSALPKDSPERTGLEQKLRVKQIQNGQQINI